MGARINISYHISYCTGADGPTIRVDVSSKERLKALKDICMRLSSAEIAEFDLSTLPDIKFDGLRDLHMLLHEARQSWLRRLLPSAMWVPDFSSPKSVVRVGDEGSETAFCWVCDREGWLEAADLIDGLLSDDKPGHQYFDYGAIGDVALVIALV